MSARQRLTLAACQTLFARCPLAAQASLWAFALLIALSPQAWADTRRLAIAQADDLSMQVRIDPSLVPDAQILRYPTRMVILLPDKAFPKGFASGTLRVDPASRVRVSVSHQNNATAITVRGDRVTLGIQDLSALTRPQAAPVLAPESSPGEGASAPPTAILAQSAPVSSQATSTRQAGPSPHVTPPPLRHHALPRATPPAPHALFPGASRQALPDAAPSPAAPQAGGAGSVAPAASPDSAPEPLPPDTPLDDVPLSTLMKGREPVVTDATLIRLAGGLLVVLVLAVLTIRLLARRHRARRKAARSPRGVADPVGRSHTHQPDLAARRRTYDAPESRAPDSLSRNRPDVFSSDAAGSVRPRASRPPRGLLGWVAAWLQARRARETQRQRDAVRQMNPAFDILETRDLGHGKSLHRVDLWGRQLIIATSSRSITLLAVLDDEGQDLYFNDAQAENGRLLAQMVGERDTLRAVFQQAERHWTPVDDLPEFARSQPVEQRHRAHRLEAAFDDVYRKYLRDPSPDDDTDDAPEAGLFEEGLFEEDPLKSEEDARAITPQTRGSRPPTARAATVAPHPPEPAPVQRVRPSAEPRATQARQPSATPTLPPRPVRAASGRSVQAAESPRPRRERPPAPQPLPPARSPDDWIVLDDYDDEFDAER